MISPAARLAVRRLPLDCLQVKEHQMRYATQLARYIELLEAHPGQYAGVLSVVPSDTHPGMYALLDGYHRFCAYIMAGRSEALCLVIEEKGVV